jgi:hypothetical protein
MNCVKHLDMFFWYFLDYLQASILRKKELLFLDHIFRYNAITNKNWHKRQNDLKLSSDKFTFQLHPNIIEYRCN